MLRRNKQHEAKFQQSKSTEQTQLNKQQTFISATLFQALFLQKTKSKTTKEKFFCKYLRVAKEEQAEN